MKKQQIRDVVDDVVKKVWPKTKKELEKVIKESKKAIDKGEKYVKSLSEKGAENAKKLSGILKKEKLYYSLGKLASQVSPSRWQKDKKIISVLKEIKKIEKELKK